MILYSSLLTYCNAIQFVNVVGITAEVSCVYVILCNKSYLANKCWFFVAVGVNFII